MGLLDLFRKQTRAPAPLPAGSFTVDPAGRIITSTIPSSFPQQTLLQVSTLVLESFKNAAAAGQVLAELSVQFSGLTLTARELRGGAIIFLSPRSSGRRE